MTRTCPDCGVVYDDVDHRTYCPHPHFAMRTSAGRMAGGRYVTKVCRSIAELDEFQQASDDRALELADERGEGITAEDLNELVETLARRAALGPVIITLDVEHAIATIGLAQLALRHPEVGEHATTRGIELVEVLANALGEELRPLVDAGWDGTALRA